MALDQSTVDAAGVGEPDPWLAGLEKRYGESVSRMGVDVTKQEAAIAEQKRVSGEEGAALGKVGEKMLETVKAAPDPTKVKEERMPDYQRPALSSQDLQTTFSALLVASMFAGKASRTPYANTMTAMTGAMNGFLKENDRQIQESLQIFDRNLGAIKERNAALQRDMEANWKKNRNDLQAYQIESDLIRNRYGVEQDAYGFESKSLAERVKYDQQVITANEKALDRAMVVRQQLADRKETRDQREADAKARRAESNDRFREMMDFRREMAQKKYELDPGAVSPETVDFYAKMAVAGNWDWRTGLSRSKGGSQIITAVESRVPSLARELGMTPQDVGTSKATYVALASALKDRTKFQAAGQQFVNNMQAQAGLVEKYLEAGSAGGVPALNKWIQAGRKSIAGDPDVSALDTVIRGLAREHQRIVTGVTSNAQLHVQAQTTADELLNIAQTPEQIRMVIKVMREEAEQAIKAGGTEIKTLQDDLRKVGAGAAGAPGTPAGGTAAGAGGASGAPTWTPEKERRLQELRAKQNAPQ